MTSLEEADTERIGIPAIKHSGVRWGVLSAVLIVLAAVALEPRSQQQNIDAYLCSIAFGEDAQMTKRLVELFCAATIFGNPQAGQEYAELREQLPSGDFIRANPNEALPFFLAVINGTSQPTFTLLFLVYGLQHFFILEGREDIVHRISVPKDDGTLQAYVFRYEIPPLSPGLHNVVLLLINTHDVNTPPFQKTVVSSAPMSFYMGEGEPPKVSPARPPDSVFLTGMPRPPESRLEGGVFLSLVPDPTDEQLNGWQVELLPGQRLDYYLELRSLCPTPGPKDYLITSMLEGVQLPLQVGGQEPRAHLRLDCDQRASVPASLIAPEQPGSYVLVPYGIMNPYNLRSEANPHEGPMMVWPSSWPYTLVVKPSK